VKNMASTKLSSLVFLGSMLYASLGSILSFMKRSKRGLIGFIILLYFATIALIGPEIIPLDLSVDLSRGFMPMSLEHIFGTDGAGRDIFALIVHGSTHVLSVASIAGLITVLIGVSVGLIAGFKNGRVDSALMFIADIALTIPGVPLILVLASFIGYGVTDPFLLGAILSVTAWASLAIAIRSQVLSLKEREFIEAAQTLGLGTFHIVFYEILPHMTYYVAINILYAMVGAVYANIGLFFLGIIPFNVTNWGLILNFAQYAGVFHTEGLLSKGALLGPIIHIVLLQTGLVLLCNGLEESFNPRLRED